MKGKKIELAKKAGIALAYKAIEEKDKVGMIVFGKEIKSEVMPTDDFERLLTEITTIKANQETNMTKTIKHAINMFPKGNVTKHLILLTDALPTVGKKPEEETLEAVSEAMSAGITISLIGVKLDRKGRELAEKITSIGEGRLYAVRNLENLDKIILEDYYSLG